jgi:hypothetical protein
VGSAVWAQYPGPPVDNGQQYWQNYWRFHNRQYAPASRQSVPPQYGRVGGYYPAAAPVQKPFSNYRPEPTAFEKYWPLMVYPNSFGGYY